MSGVPVARLLIVDDETDLVLALCRILELQCYSTVGFTSGKLALDALRSSAADEKTRFDLLITDLMMPDMDGFTLLGAAHDIDPDLVSIVMTGKGTIDSAVRAMKSGALDYLLKPFNLTIALPVLARALAVRKLRRENVALTHQLKTRTTELEQINSQLQLANRDLDAFNSSISHDIRGHLSRVIGFSQLLIDGKAGPLNKEQTEYLGHVADGGYTILHLSDDLLRFSRLAQQQVVKEPMELTTLVRQIFSDLAGSETGRRVNLSVGALPDAYADPPLLKQVFVNLLSNAIKFSSRVAHPVVTVGGKQIGKECSYWVGDNGAGFDMRHAGELFEMFHRLHTDAEFKGTGIGLSIVQRIIERHGGQISVQAAVGKGAQFIFTLPARV